MKEFALYLLLLLVGVAWAQNEETVNEEDGSEVPITETIDDPCSKCVCPQEEVDQGNYQLFPPSSVFLISPLPESPVQVVPGKMTIPGYIEHLESGYSDKDYKQIPPSD